jgi:multiple sugar transport system permease protein
MVKSVSAGELVRQVRRIPDGPHWAYLFVLPSVVLVGIVVAYPMVTGLLLSFQRYRLNDIRRQGEFVGLGNFERLFVDPVALAAITTTITYVAAVVIGSLLLGLVAAILLAPSFRGAWIARLVVLVPLFMPTLVASYNWSFLLDARAGVLNDVLMRLGILTAPKPWFSDPQTALAAVIIIDIWARFPLFAIFLIAAIHTIPDELVQAAAVDGAGSWARFRHIKLPLLLPIIAICSILVTISVAQSPDIIAILTKGGPARATTTLAMYTFQTAYLSFDLGYAAAIGSLLFALLAIFIVIYVRVSGMLRRG